MGWVKTHVAIMWLSLTECIGCNPSDKSVSRQNKIYMRDQISPVLIFTRGSPVGSKLRLGIEVASRC